MLVEQESLGRTDAGLTDVCSRFGWGYFLFHPPCALNRIFIPLTIVLPLVASFVILLGGPDVDRRMLHRSDKDGACVVMSDNIYRVSLISSSDASLREPLAELFCIEVHTVCLPHPE